jgi:hypothetical protein
MLSLRYFVFILLTICLREAASSQQTQSTDRLLLAVLGATLGCGLLVKMVAYRWIAREFVRSQRPGVCASLEFHRHRRTIEWVWCCLIPPVMFSTGFFAWSRNFEPSGLSATVGLVSCFLPAVAFVLLVEMSAAQVDQLADDQVSDFGQRCTAKSPLGWLPFFWTRVRLGDTAGLVVFLLPVLLFSAISNSQFALNNLALSNVDQQSGLGLHAVVGVFLFLAILLAMPHVMTLWSGGQPLPQKLKNRVDFLISKANLRAVGSVQIPSQRRWAGAAIVGWLPGFRKLWVGDGLIGLLNNRQLDMVLLHELAHVKRVHFAWRLAPVLAATAFAAIAWKAIQQIGWENQPLIQAAIILLTSCGLIVGLGWMARNCELDADQTACDLAAEVVQWSNEQSPAAVLSEALVQLLPHPEDQKATWLHPSLNHRLRSLSQWRTHR